METGTAEEMTEWMAVVEAAEQMSDTAFVEGMLPFAEINMAKGSTLIIDFNPIFLYHNSYSSNCE
ncbi:MAG: hypothetical protein HDR03_10945 [Lachnospiraceae bacterium]|nr:hypothetical protein [Lachnospiraceae bacterium]